MPSDRTVEALETILDHIALARRFCAGLTDRGFADDAKTRYATIRCLEIISEASRRLSPALRQRHPEAPRTDIAAAGNVYRHDYDAVLAARIWITAHQGLDVLEPIMLEEWRAAKPPHE